MIWLKRRFYAAEFAPYQDKLGELMMATPSSYSEFLMVSTETDKPLVSDYFIGLPGEPMDRFFDGFERITEADLPSEIDTFHLGDQTKEPFTSRFRFRKRR